MSVLYKITYEHRSGNEARLEEFSQSFDNEPSQEEVYNAAMKDSSRFFLPPEGVTAVAGLTVISVVKVS